MKLISWQLVTIIGIVILGVVILELYALSKGINGTGLTVAIGSMIGVPAVLVTRKVTQKKVK